MACRRSIDDRRPQPVDFPDEFFLFPFRQLAVVRVMRLLDGLVRRADDVRPALPAVGADAPLRAFGPGMPARAFRQPVGVLSVRQHVAVQTSHRTAPRPTYGVCAVSQRGPCLTDCSTWVDAMR